MAAEVEEKYPWSKKFDRMVRSESKDMSRRTPLTTTSINLPMQFWRGFANWYPIRKDLIDRTSYDFEPSRESWADVHETTFHPGVDIGDYYPLVTLPDHCQHKYLVHTEGNSYSG